MQSFRDNFHNLFRFLQKKLQKSIRFFMNMHSSFFFLPAGMKNLQISLQISGFQNLYFFFFGYPDGICF